MGVELDVAEPIKHENIPICYAELKQIVKYKMI